MVRHSSDFKVQFAPMRIVDLIQPGKPCISFEFFPPKTDEGMASLLATIATLKIIETVFCIDDLWRRRQHAFKNG